MKTVVVIDQHHKWLELPDATVLTARRYLAEPESGNEDTVRMLNLCRTGRYQGRGYYVSLLAEARGQRAIPDVKAIEDLRPEDYVRALDAEIQPLVQETLHHDDSERFELNVYLGKHPDHQSLAEQLFAKVRVPLLRALFARAGGTWHLDALQAMGLADIPPQDRALFIEAVKSFIAESPASRRQAAKRDRPRLAILWDPSESPRPSNEEALQRFVQTAPLVGLEAELIGPDALERLPEFDGLFNRASPVGTIYEFVRRAESLGMPVVDDPESIVKCGNKVYMQELMNRHRITTPRTLIVHRGNVDEVVPTLGLPCVLKLPDSGFGLDVVKIESDESLRKETERLFNQSELLVAQAPAAIGPSPRRASSRGSRTAIRGCTSTSRARRRPTTSARRAGRLRCWRISWQAARPPEPQGSSQFGPSIGVPAARYSSRIWLAIRYFGRMFSSGVTGTRNHT